MPANGNDWFTAPTALRPGELLKLKHFASMNRFRKLGFINYDVGDNLHVRSSILNVVLHDDEGDSTASAARSRTARQKKVSEPPPEHGTVLDRDRAKRPTLPGVQSHRK
jgi:hypothetical protein